MDYDRLLNSLGDMQYLLTDIPRNVIVKSVKLDERGIEIILERGIEAFAEDNALELAEEAFPAVFVKSKVQSWVKKSTEFDNRKYRVGSREVQSLTIGSAESGHAKCRV